MFRLHWRGPSRIATDTKHANAGRLQWVLPKVAISLGSLYTRTRWLLRRWRWKLGLEVSIHVITSKFSEILGSTTYKNKKLLPHSIIATLGHTQHHDRSTLTTNTLINFKLKKGEETWGGGGGFARHDEDYNIVRYCDNNVRKLSDLQYSLN